MVRQTLYQTNLWSQEKEITMEWTARTGLAYKANHSDNLDTDDSIDAEDAVDKFIGTLKKHQDKLKKK